MVYGQDMCRYVEDISVAGLFRYNENLLKRERDLDSTDR